MSRADKIHQMLTRSFAPQHLEVRDESHQHSRGKETHFHVTIVSDTFQGLGRVKRAQAVYAVLQPLFSEGLHALTQSQFTPEEWEKGAQAVESAKCQSKANKQ